MTALKILKSVFRAGRLAVFTLLAAGICYAAPAYGPDMPKRGQWFMGFEANYVFGREMPKGLGDARARQFFYNASYGIYDWLSFDGKLGAGDIAFDTVGQGRLKYDVGFSGAYGLRFRIYNNEPERMRGILGFQHISAHPPSEKINDVNYTAIWDEWQCSLLFSKGFWRLDPYIGVKVSQLYIIRKDSVEESWSWNGAKDHFGLIAGSKFNLPKNWYLDVEGRFIDETALSAALSYKS
ncbi:MAG: hypothetical protein PHO42_02590 [Candidatus Omnitrophica bacterium]|nr:hypothetical protein [Candidatus Omnitrophota bacterium]